MANPPSSLPVALTIAGSDSGAVAGIQADLLSFAAHGAYGTTAITCLTAQNPTGITSIHATPADFVEAQLKQLFAYFPIRAAKTGMLFNQEIIETVAAFLKARDNLALVVDPVSVTSSGDPLLDEDAIRSLKEDLLPLATVITPNLDEARLLLGQSISDRRELEVAAVELAQTNQATVFLKGGHLNGDELVDFVAYPDGSTKQFTQDRIHDIDTHGSGCTLSSSIAARLARGLSPSDAIEVALDYLRRGMTQSLSLPPRKFINHFPK